MFLRVYFVARSIFNYSVYSDAYFKKMCREHGFNPGVRFTFKCYLATYPERTITFLFFSTLAIIAYIFRILEFPFFLNQRYEPEPPLKQYYDSLYFTIVTITTVGYGDMQPNTLPAKFLVMISAIWGAIMVSLIVLAVSNVLDLNKN